MKIGDKIYYIFFLDINFLLYLENGVIWGKEIYVNFYRKFVDDDENVFEVNCKICV